GNSSVVFAGSDRGDNGTSHTKVGPLDRDSQIRNTSGGNSGLSVRIIPANAPPGSSRSSGSVFDNRDEPEESSATTGTPGRGSSQPRQNSRSYDDGQQSSRPSRSNVTPRTDPNAGDDEIASGNPRTGSAPVLRRSTDESTAVGDADNSAGSSDSEAIVLKAALVNLNVSVTNRSG